MFEAPESSSLKHPYLWAGLSKTFSNQGNRNCDFLGRITHSLTLVVDLGIKVEVEHLLGIRFNPLKLSNIRVIDLRSQLAVNSPSILTS